MDKEKLNSPLNYWDNPAGSIGDLPYKWQQNSEIDIQEMLNNLKKTQQQYQISYQQNHAYSTEERLDKIEESLKTILNLLKLMFSNQLEMKHSSKTEAEEEQV